ncbi:MAG: hypothetical protein D6746_03465 [Bacteroidetes bacterium]|nr:MAG: hypothetical protein D6746_03465 [Bacteroidota bacterium]
MLILMRALLPLLLLLATAGCAGVPHGDARTETATLEIENRHFLDATIYVFRGALRVRLGTVTGSTRQAFTLGADLVRGGATLRFVADPIGGRRAVLNEQVPVFPGDVVYLVIPP